jgi:hypothetical protein
VDPIGPGKCGERIPGGPVIDPDSVGRAFEDGVGFRHEIKD